MTAGAEERVWTPREIRRRYEAGERDFVGLEITEPDHAGREDTFCDAVLDGADFSRSFIVANFKRASLRGCSFREANVKTCAFNEANLEGCDFRNAAIDGATFRSASMQSASFEGAHAQGHALAAGDSPDDRE